MSTITLDAPPPTETQVGKVDHFSSAAERERQAEPQPKDETLPLGPLKVVHAFWLAGMSCDGCSIAAVGATAPSVEDLIAGTIPGVPRVVLHHSVLSVESGHEFIHNYEMAERGELGAPYVVIYEGSIADERIAAASGGYFSAMGARKMEDGSSQPIPTASWLKRLAPGAAAVIAVGTCATWGGIP
ncbi:MAG: hydrogenase expression protein HypE, partial [Chthoniobacterales bacterium]